MFDRELNDLLRGDKERLQRILEAAIRDLLQHMDKVEGGDPQKLPQKCANIRSVFKLAAALRTDRAGN
jgi:hypothetical protein